MPALVPSSPPSALRKTDAKVGERVAGRYVLGKELGRGGMGVVYRATDEATGKVVALKQLLSTLAGARRKTVEALFEREYHTLVRLKHPRIIEVFEYGLTDDGPYYTMELLEGRDLSQVGALPHKEACRHLRDVASSLALLHAHRLVHRDVTARNVRFDGEGRAKLIDFGALAPFGVSNEVVGTPLCLAPEVLQHMPLDQRTDLYGLGTLAYWVFTGHHPFPARHAQDLPELWGKQVIAPSRHDASIPAAIDALVLSLVSIDPLGRPASAAAVIDQLTAVAGLQPEEHEHADSYLSSSRLVGRQAERAWVDRRIARMMEGEGSEILLEGAAGIGKTRLLREVCLSAQLKGVMALTADAQASAGPFGAVIDLALRMLGAFPEVALREGIPHAGLLGHLSPELAERFAQVARVPLVQDLGERRARFQTAFHDWFLAVAKHCAMLVAIDNLQAADDNSAAFLAGLGHEARQMRMLVVATQRKGEEAKAPAPVRAFSMRASRMKLTGLDKSACEDLAESLFGDVSNTGRVGRLLYEKGAGVPQQCVDLAQLLVHKGIAKYVAGTWVLPQDVLADELPSRADEIVVARLSNLSPAAKSYCDALSVHRKPVSIERCLSLAEGKNDSETFAALAELVAEQILANEGGNYRFAQVTLREAVLSHMDEGQRRLRHRAAAETLLASDDGDVGARLEAAWHLLQAGEDGRGADIAARAGLQFIRSANIQESADQVADAIQTALRIYEKQGRSDAERAGLLLSLVAVGYYSSDWRIVLNQGERALSLALRLAGLGSVNSSEPVPPPLPEEHRRQLIISCCAIVPAAIGTSGTCLDTARVERLSKIVEPLGLFGDDHIGGLMHRWSVAECALLQGREVLAEKLVGELLVAFKNPKMIEALGDGRWRSIYCGLLFVMGILESYGLGNGALARATELEGMGVRVWAMTADQVRLLYHALRGESGPMRKFRERVELFAVQGGTTWQAEMFWPALLLNHDALAGDTMAARRTAEQLARRAEDVEVLRPYADAARAVYLALRGELPAAIALYEKILPEFPCEQRVAWQSTRGHFAQALNRAGNHGRAKEIALEVVERMQAGDEEKGALFLESQRQLALAEAGLGNRELAAQMLDELLARHQSRDNPMLVGLLHKARAEVALLSAERHVFETHLYSAEARFRAAENPALIGQWERLVDKAVRAGMREASQIGSGADAALMTRTLTTLRTLEDVSGAEDPCEYALKLIVQRARAQNGYLYLFTESGMRLLAATGPNSPPPEIEEELRQAAERAQIEGNLGTGYDTRANASSGEPGNELDANSTMLVEAPNSEARGAYRLLLLNVPRGDGHVPIGGVIVEGAGVHAYRANTEFLEEVTSALYGRLRATTGFSTIS